ncbi:hypothetical protein AB0K93_03330 [Streptomyces sp. NPDC052676]|uniref:hypothetical protein n=1 Tax=Streptomyces sp. NPDC052676 TaxID=3154953 RepID=UPI00343C0BE1
MKKVITVTPIVPALSAVTVGTAAADDYSHSSPGSVLVNVAQIDNPTEDVLDHTLNFGDGIQAGLGSASSPARAGPDTVGDHKRL